MKVHYKIGLLIITQIINVIIFTTLTHPAQAIKPNFKPDQVAGASANLKPDMGQGYYKLVNEYRVAHGKRPLKKSFEFEAQAKTRAYTIATGLDEWSHEAFQIVMDKNLVNDVYIGENLARGFTDFSIVIDAWDKSPKHKEVLLSDWCEMGIGEYKTFWVAHFKIDTNNSCYE